MSEIGIKFSTTICIFLKSIRITTHYIIIIIMGSRAMILHKYNYVV